MPSAEPWFFTEVRAAARGAQQSVSRCGCVSGRSVWFDAYGMPQSSEKTCTETEGTS
jgi:hypothetical protein